MAFCEFCDEGVRFDKETDWDGSPAGTGKIYHYSCMNPDCPNDGGEVYAYAGGGVAKEVGVW